MATASRCGYCQCNAPPKFLTQMQPNNKNAKQENSSSSELKDYRPASIYTYVVSNGPKLIGWDDDKFRHLLEQYRAKHEAENAKLPPEKRKESAEVTGFRLGSLVASAAKDFVYSRSDPQLDDLKSDLKKLESSQSKTGTIPNQTGINVRDMRLYQNVLSTLKYQRDMYIMGKETADKNRIKRQNTQSLPAMEVKPNNDIIQSMPLLINESLGKQQLNDIASWFIPSKTMHDAILPTILWTLSEPNPLQPGGGVLRRQFSRSIIDLIPLSQPLLDSSLKSTILWALKDESIKMGVRGSSLSYLGGTQKNDKDIDTESAGGRVVATKTILVKK
jgi:hypothetical protein